MTELALRAKVDRARAYWRALLAAEGGLWTLAALLAAFLACFHVDRWFVLSIEARVGAWAVLAVLFTGLFVALILRPVLRPRPAEEVAAIVERRFPQLRERLLSAVEFAGAPPERLRGVSLALVSDLQAEAAAAAAELPFEKAFRRDGLARAALALAAALGLLALHLLVAGPAFGRFLERMALSHAPVWRDTRVQVEPLRTKLLKGSDFTIGIAQEGKRVRRARLRFRFGEGRWNVVDLQADPSGRFAHLLKNVTESVTYYATAGDGVTDRGLAQVVEPAAVIGAKLTLEYPAYMERPPATLTAETGGIAAPVGTRVRLELKANKPLELASATLADRRHPQGARGARPAALSWRVEGDRIFGALTVAGNGHYALRLKDRDGFFAPEEQVFPIKAIPDQTPEVQLLDPAGDLDVVPDARVRLSIVAKDDYGVQEVRVPYAIGERRGALPAGKGGRRVRHLELENLWEIAHLRARPGDTIRYRIEALDFDDITGPHVGKTAEYQLRIIDRGEAERRYEEQRAELLRQLGELAREQREIRSETAAHRGAARMNAEALAGTEERQRSAASMAQELARRVEEMARMAETNNLASRPELEGQRSARSALQRLGQEAMPQAANRIGSAQAQAAQPAQARRELEQADQQQQRILEELQRVAQQLRPVSELERLAERLERLAREQRNLLGQTDRLLPETLGRALNELTPEQRAALQQQAQAQQSLQRATAQAMQDLERASRTAAQPAQAEASRAAAEGLRQSGVTEQQQGAAQNTQQNALGQARSQQENAARSLEEAARQLRDSLSANDPRALQRQLRQALQRLGRLMQQQREAMEQARRSLNREQQEELARQQRELERQVRELARQLERLQRRSPSAGRAARNLDEAGSSLGQSSRSLSQGQQGQAQGQQQQAMRAMQRAMESLQQAMAEAQGQQDPFAALRRELDRLISRQQAISQATRRIDEERPAPLRPEDAAELKRLARQQGEVEDATARLESDLPGEVFRAFSQTARRAMERSRSGLDAANPREDPTRRAQQQALTLLDQLKRALDADPGDSSNGNAGGGGQGGGGGGGEADPELLKRIAEIRLLRFMEQAIRSRTQELDAGRSPGMPPTEAQRQQAEETARQQQQARALAEGVARALSRYRSLAGRVDQAGRHMGEAQRLLDQGDTGEVTQEQENQAILRLTEALRQAQQQAQQQAQGSSGRQPPQQQAGSRPSSGVEQQQAQGASPAMRSLQRRTGLQGGPLGGFGPDARGFAGLDPRAQDALRQSFREKVPAEYQDLINRYYRALSEKGR